VKNFYNEVTGNVNAAKEAVKEAAKEVEAK